LPLGLKALIPDAKADRKPNSVSPSGYPDGDGDHSSATAVADRLKRRNPRTLGRAAPFSYSVLLRMGFTRLSRSPGKPVSSYLAFSPLPSTGGIFSVALSLGSPPVAVSDHPALRSSDFPPLVSFTKGDHLFCFDVLF